MTSSRTRRRLEQNVRRLRGAPKQGERTHIFVDRERRGRVLEEDVRHPHFEGPQLRNLLGYLRGNQVAASGRGRHGDGSLRPPGCPRHNLHHKSAGARKGKIKKQNTLRHAESEAVAKRERGMYDFTPTTTSFVFRSDTPMCALNGRRTCLHRKTVMRCSPSVARLRPPRRLPPPAAPPCSAG